MREWVRGVQRGTLRVGSCSFAPGACKVLLDAAALVGTSALDLRDVPADYVALSFYKMFGLPTGLGALLVRQER